jgi:hypothetical protein
MPKRPPIGPERWHEEAPGHVLHRARGKAFGPAVAGHTKPEERIPRGVGRGPPRGGCQRARAGTREGA